VLAPIVLHVVGRAAKRGLIPRVPTAERLLVDIEAWLRTEYPDVIRSTDRRVLPSGDAELRIGLHPAAADAVIGAGDEGAVHLSARTEAPGPGYHTFVARLVERLGLALDIAWAPPGTDGSRDDAGFLTGSGRAGVERTYLGRLGAALSAVREARRRGTGGAHVGLPAGVRFTIEGALGTSLGPRDDAWLDAALADPQAALDIVPWWADATDARYLLNGALCLMWTEVRWRPPATPDERAVFDEVARLLWRALPLDPDLAYPWREWLELLDLRGLDDPAARQVARRAAEIPEDRPLIGYRRQPVTVVHEGWRLDVPGSFTERRTDEEWSGGEGGRNITIAAVATGTDRGPMAPEAFLDQVAGDFGADALHHRAGPVVGRARLRTDPSSGVEIGVLEAFSAAVGTGAAIRIEFGDPADWQWALETWHELSPA
jgi:hypothetical protein